jgi:hypothetical protein
MSLIMSDKAAAGKQPHGNRLELTGTATQPLQQEETMKKSYLPYLVVGLLVLAPILFQIAGCGGGGGGIGGPFPASTGKLQVSITDAPPANQSFASIHVRVDKVVVVPAGKEELPDNDAGLPVIATFPGGMDINILDLHFIQQLLGTAIVPAGNYNQLRLILAPNQPTVNNYVTLTSAPTQKLPLTTPSAQETGLKIPGKFNVTAGILNAILIDFDPNTAIVFAGNSGNVILKPTGIRILQVLSSLTDAGSVSGVIRSPQFRSWSSATVSVAPRNPAMAPVAAGVVFSNLSSPGVWKAPFTAFLPPSASATMPAANYRVFVQAFSHAGTQGAIFQLYSSPLFTVTKGVDTPVPPAGIVPLLP